MDGEDLGLLDGTGTEDAGGGEGGDESFIEVEDEGGAGGDGGGEGGSGDGAADAGGDQGGTGDEAGGSRSIVKFTPDLVKKALREITSSNPEFAKKFPQLEQNITKALYKDTKIRALGGLQAITALADAVETHGGIEAIEEQANELRLFRDMEAGMKKGDPLIIDGWLKDYPNGLKRLLLPAIEKIAKVDDAFVDKVVCNAADKILIRCGVYGAFTKLGESLTAGKNEDAVKSYNDIVKFFAEFKNLAAAAKGGEDSGRSSELDEREEEIEKRDRDALYRSARLEVNPLLMVQVNKLIRKFLPAGRKIKVEQANRLRKEINAEARTAMNAKSDFAAKFENLMQAGEQKPLVKFIYTRAIAELPRVVERLMREFGLRGSGSGTGGGGGSNANGSGTRRINRNAGGGGTVQSGKPKADEVDWQRTDKAVWLSSVSAGKSVGPIFLKNGKQAQW